MPKNEEKQRRMELRKDLGNRVLKPIQPKQESLPSAYLVPHACFHCRKSFKLTKSNETELRRCPQCGQSLYWMGRNFRPPKMDDKKQWEKVLKLYAAGFRFIGSGNHDEPDLPKALRDVDAFIRANSNHVLRAAEPSPEMLSHYKNIRF